LPAPTARATTGKLSFTTAPWRRCRVWRVVGLKPAGLLRISDAAQAALLADWLQGCYAARPWTAFDRTRSSHKAVT
jgi:hypothetical protein